MPVPGNHFCGNDHELRRRLADPQHPKPRSISSSPRHRCAAASNGRKARKPRSGPMVVEDEPRHPARTSKCRVHGNDVTDKGRSTKLTYIADSTCQRTRTVQNERAAVARRLFRPGVPSRFTAITPRAHQLGGTGDVNAGKNQDQEVRPTASQRAATAGFRTPPRVLYWRQCMETSDSYLRCAETMPGVMPPRQNATKSRSVRWIRSW